MKTLTVGFLFCRAFPAISRLISLFMLALIVCGAIWLMRWPGLGQQPGHAYVGSLGAPPANRAEWRRQRAMAIAEKIHKEGHR